MAMYITVTLKTHLLQYNDLYLNLHKSRTKKNVFPLILGLDLTQTGTLHEIYPFTSHLCGPIHPSEMSTYNMTKHLPLHD